MRMMQGLAHLGRDLFVVRVFGYRHLISCLWRRDPLSWGKCERDSGYSQSQIVLFGITRTGPISGI